MSPKALPFVLLQGFLFGSTLIASRFSIGQFAPTTYIGLRLILASLGHVAIYALLRRYRWPRDLRLWRRAALLGVLGTALPMTAIVTSLQFQSSGVTSTLITAGPAILVLMAHFTLPEERLDAVKGLGVGLALGGALLLALRGETGLADVTQASPIGYGLVGLAMVANSAMTVYARVQLREYDSIDVASIRMFAAALTVAPLSALFVGVDLGDVTPPGYFALTYAALAGTFSGMLLAFYVVKHFSATAAAVPAYIIPIVATFGGALLLDETITATMIAGMVLIALGISLINVSGESASPTEPV